MGNECRVFARGEPGLEMAGGGAARSFGRAAIAPPPLRPSLPDQPARIDWAPDLGSRIGSADWWRGLITCTALCAASWALSPGLPKPLTGDVPAPLAGAELDEARAQAIAPLGLGADTGRRMAPGDLVVPLAQAPERALIDLSATLGQGDMLARALERAGIGHLDAQAATAIVARDVALDAIPTGTRITMTLGRRPNRMVARPLETLQLRARFDLALSLTRGATGLTSTRRPIAIDATPMRIQGLVGSSLYRSMRAAGVPARVGADYLKALASRLSLGSDVTAADGFDLIVERQRAATGETRMGALLFAGLDQAGKKLQLVRFDPEGGTSGDQWFDAQGPSQGQYEQRGTMGMPVAGHITSNFGMRFHPLLGFTRMHKGVDIGAPWGTPIYAVIDGVVQFAGHSSGYGNFVRLAHAGGLGSGYGHMSRIAVSAGTHVARGQVIGYVGSTGMSTGPHLHWEIWRDGQAINPLSIAMTSVGRLSGDKLRAFKAKVAGLLAVRVGG